MRFLKNPKFDPLEARTSGFTGSMGGKRVAGVVFGPKPTPDPNFIKIGVGGRTGVLHFLIFGLLRVLSVFEFYRMLHCYDFKS